MSHEDRTDDDRKGLMQRLAGALFEEASEPIGPAQDAGVPPVARSTGVRHPDADVRAHEARTAQTKFEHRLSEVLSTQRPVVAGRLHTIDLDDIRQQFGPRWQQVAHRAMEIAAGVIEHRLAAADVMAPVDDVAFVVLFAELAEPEAQFKAAVLAREIREKLLGELGAGCVRAVSAQVRVVEPPVAGAPVPDFAALASSFRAVAKPVPRLEPIPDLIAAGEAPPQVAVDFRPMWFPAKGVVPAFTVRLRVRDPDGSVREGWAAYRQGIGRPSLAELDRQVLALAVLDHRRLFAQHGRCVLHVPLHTATLLDHLGGKLLDLIRLQSEAQRRFLLVELHDPRGLLTSDQIGRVVDRLRPLVRGVGVASGPAPADVDRVARADATLAVLDLEALAHQRSAVSNLTAGLSAWVRAARSQRLQTAIHGIDSSELLTAAISSGADFLSGLAVAPDEPALQAAHTFRPPTQR
ncbi:MAG: EAL domain-containing protein [Alphaproteobacteria bacterium]|nr:EAL domain-containing protein [Alphaproteobacteria bacterium]TAD90741.1 MAG: EAL domain-containing protein [Alphaproteobacteria bacterium]